MNCSSFVFAFSLCASVAVAQTTSSTPSASTPSKTPSATITPGAPSVSSSGPALQPRGIDATATATPNKVVATVNGKQITAKEAADMIDALSPQDRKRYESNLAQVVQQIFAAEQMANDAAKENLDQKPPTKQELELSRDNILARAYLTNLIENPAASERAKQYYDAHPPEFDQAKVSGILVAFNPPGTPATSAAVTRTESDAQLKSADLAKKIKNGGDFAALARTESDQPQTASKGGDMGGFVTGDPNVPPDIRDAVAKLQPSQVSEPLRTTLGGVNGYLIIKLDSRTHIPFDQVKQSLIPKLELDKYKIHVEDPQFFAAAAPRPAMNTPSLARPNSSKPPAAPGTTTPKPPER
ncbi:MAG TPA: peptidylprolyl isomerase [Bryobacteraceae bacterium]|nr:peptidylprolyl isomerase [Bryobacteraceae bacterium]